MRAAFLKKRQLQDDPEISQSWGNDGSESASQKVEMYVMKVDIEATRRRETILRETRQEHRTNWDGTFRALSGTAFLYLAMLLSIANCAAAQVTGTPSATPPMGWNSWDSYGTTVNEAQVKANADWMAKNLKAFGWQYVVVDMEWFVTNPVPEGNAKDSIYSIDAMGRYTPPVNRFPSAAQAGFKPLADYVHSLGLKFGIHILQGIPRQAVRQNDPVEGSTFHAADAANASGTCRWNFDNFDVKDTPAGQAYYDSLARLYAGWGVDLIKVDCIAFGPYKGSEIRMLSSALAKTGRPILLSLSPGPAPLEMQAEMQKYATQWRISNDIWDIWHSTEFYPQGLNDQFVKVAAWAGYPRKEHYPDADMLPLAILAPRPDGERQERLGLRTTSSGPS